MNKKRMYKDIYKEILKSKSRFLSIFIMITLAVATFIGLKTTLVSMKETINVFSENQNRYDIKISNYYGLDKFDYNIINNYKHIKEKEYGNEEYYFLNNDKDIIKIESITDKISIPFINIGRLPANKDEIILEYENKNKYNLNEYINIDNKKLKIVGFFTNPEEIEVGVKGYSNIGFTYVNIIGLVKNEFFDRDTYNSVKIKYYNNPVDDSILRQNELYDLLSPNINNKINEIKELANIEINKEQKKIDDAYLKIQDAEKLIDNNQILLNNNKIKYEKGLKEYNDAISLFSKKQKEIENGKKDIDIAKNKLRDGYDKYNKGYEEYLKNEKLLKDGEIKLKEAEIELQNGWKEYSKYYNNIFAPEEKLKEAEEKLIDGQNELDINKYLLEKNKNKLLKGKEELINAKNELDKNNELLLSKEQELLDGEKQLIIAKQEFDSNKNKILSELDIANKKLIDGQNKINEGKIELDKQKQENIEKLESGQIELNNEIDKLNKLPEPIYLINTNYNNSSLLSFNQNITSLSLISNIFPVLFFAIALLVIVTTMTRMIDERRYSMGIYKFLGYSDFDILIKFIIYISIPTIAGILFGLYIGIYHMSFILYEAYVSAFVEVLRNMKLVVSIPYIVFITLITIFIIMLSVIYIVKLRLKENTANLLKPKIDAKASRILLEKIKFIWNRLSFMHKVTFRNLFRYKIRMFMTIIGVAGCTALIFMGFGVKDSFATIEHDQYEVYRTFDFKANYKYYVSNDEKDDFINKYYNDIQYLKIQSMNGYVNNGYKEEVISVEIFDNTTNIDDFLGMYSIYSKDRLKLSNDGIYISRRLSELLNKNIGDTIIIKDLYNNKYEFKISNILENTLGYYVYMNKEVYEKTTNNEFNNNSLLIKNNDNIEKKMINDDSIQNILRENYGIELLENISKGLNTIVVVIVVLAAILAMVVIYNLMNVNILERKREISTIKVLGFYNSETTMYIYREIFLLTIMGILIGYVVGYLIHTQLIYNMTAEVSLVLNKKVRWTTYLYSGLMTMIFSFAVNIIMYKNIKDINMVEALKVED